MSLFTFIFLSCEFLFVDIISLTTKGINVVNAQNYVLGSSVLGFFLYSFLDKHKSIYIVTCILSLISFILLNVKLFKDSLVKIIGDVFECYDSIINLFGGQCQII